MGPILPPTLPLLAGASQLQASDVGGSAAAGSPTMEVTEARICTVEGPPMLDSDGIENARKGVADLQPPSLAGRKRVREDMETQ